MRSQEWKVLYKRWLRPCAHGSEPHSSILNSEREHERLMTRAVIIFGWIMEGIRRGDKDESFFRTLFASFETDHIRFLANERIFNDIIGHTQVLPVWEFAAYGYGITDPNRKPYTDHIKFIVMELEKRDLHILSPRDLETIANDTVCMSGRALRLANLRHTETPVPILKSILQKWQLG